MESFFSRLRRAREAKHLTLSDMSDATSINVTFLEAIEQGQTTVLPEPYIRAFIREYARVLGLDPEETLRGYEEAVRPIVPELKEEHPADAAYDVTPSPRTQEETPAATLNPRLALAAIIIIVVIALIIVLWNLSRSPTGEPAGGMAPPDSAQAETFESSGISGGEHVPPDRSGTQNIPDSLTLTARAIDSVWILVQRDDLPPVDVILKAGIRVSWKARNRFLLTIGNAGGVDVTLNGKPFGPLGQRGAVVRNREFNRQSLNRK
jgi:cytoskeleton protein RodZ